MLKDIEAQVALHVLKIKVCLKMSKFLQATNLTWSDSTATSVFQICPVIHCDYYKWNVYECANGGSIQSDKTTSIIVLSKISNRPKL